MGSIDKCCISGFLCRLCSEMHRTVIHIYGDQGQRLCLVEKINGYLPITISPTDPLPKTICTTCLRRVEQHYALLMRLTEMRKKHRLHLERSIQRDVSTFDVSSPDCSDDESSVRGSQNAEHRHKVTRPSSSANATILDDSSVASGSGGSSNATRTQENTSSDTEDTPLSAIVTNNITN